MNEGFAIVTGCRGCSRNCGGQEGPCLSSQASKIGSKCRDGTLPQRALEEIRGAPPKGMERRTQTLLSFSSFLGPAVTQPDGCTRTQDTQGLGRGVSWSLPGMSSRLRPSQPFRKVSNNQDPQQTPALPAKRERPTHTFPRGLVCKQTPKTGEAPILCWNRTPPAKQTSFFSLPSAPSAPAPRAGAFPPPPFVPLPHPPCGFCYHRQAALTSTQKALVSGSG